MSDKTRVLIVEDDPGLQKQLKWALKSDFDLLLAENREQALQLFEKHQPPVVVHDLGLPPDERGVSEGHASIRQMLQQSPDTRIIIMTGKGDRKDAIELIGIGAHDFLGKPVDTDQLRLIIERAGFVSELQRASREARSSVDNGDELYLLPGVIGRSRVMRQVAEMVRKVAPTLASTFIQGPSGSGKELIARAIHELSERASGPFVAINCAAIPESLLESELFGHEKGAFTGADKRSIGRIEQANGGTLFLDEIGDMAYELQAKILRFLQERIIQRVGGKTDIPVDVRVVSATHQDLGQLIADGRFREDLYYRINEFELLLPPLSERENDVELIARHLLHRFAESHQKGQLHFTEDALLAIRRHEWQGNIRQLSNVINKAVILSSAEWIGPDDLGLAGDSEDFDQITLNNIPTLKQAREETELRLIMKAMRAHDNNVKDVAAHLGVSRQRVYELLRKHDIPF